MQAEYVFVRRKGEAPNKPRPHFDSQTDMDVLLGEARATRITPAPDLQVHHEILTGAEAADVMRDDTVLAGALVMPMTLIKPLEASATDDAAVAQAKTAGMSWGIPTIGADQSDASGAGVTVAVLDTGIDSAHPAFKGVTFEQRDFIGSETPDKADDENGHGTHCAATIFGRDVDGVRIGVARGVTKALIGRVLDQQARGSTTAVAKGLEWAIAEKANVISLSVGFDFPGMVEKMQKDFGLPAALASSRALRAFRDNLRLFDSLMAFAQAQAAFGSGCLVVAASGNESRADENPDFRIEVSLPAASNGIISVGALKKTGEQLTVAPFSNVDPVLSAPGTDIVSALRQGGLAAGTGTSMACPHVAGAAALWWEHLRKRGLVTAELVRASLINTARLEGLAPGLGSMDRGAGLVRTPPKSG